MDKIYDLIILGGGPGSMSAGIYAMQLKMDTLLIEKECFGGQVATTSMVTNYLGFPSITGSELAENMHKHLAGTGIEIRNEEVVYTDLGQDIKVVKTHSGEYYAKTVIIGIGTTIRKLSVDNESKYVGKGISYNSLKERDAYENKNVAVVGGGNSAIEDALYLSEKAKKVYLIHRRNEFRGDPLLVENLYKQIDKKHNIELVLECKPHSIIGADKVEKFVVTHIPTESQKALDVDGIFVCIGRGADTEIIDEKVAKNESGYIITNEQMQTNIPGVYAIGDIRTTPLRQIITACADGAIASVSAKNFLKNGK